MCGVPRFPTQLVETTVNLILALCLYILVKRGVKKDGQPIGIYLIVYSIMRFILEFARDDEIRGGLLGLSTSQWISLILLPLGIYLAIRKDRVDRTEEN